MLGFMCYFSFAIIMGIMVYEDTNEDKLEGFFTGFCLAPLVLLGLVVFTYEELYKKRK